MTEPLFVAFAGQRRVASGPLRDVLPVLKQRFDRDGSELVLVFEVETGRQVDFDLRGSVAEVLERALPAPRGPGRPKLGVTSREISLLPRQWEWLEQQPNGISPALRRLVEHASKTQPGSERARRQRGALSQILSALGGNLPGYEEACRALFAGETARFALSIESWPQDLRQFALHHASEASRTETEGTSDAGSALLRDLHQQVWSYGDYTAVERLVAPQYTIHSDPGDAWEGRTLDRDGYTERVRYSRTAFPDLVFTVDDTISAGERVAVRWHAEGTHEGTLRGLPATGRRLRFAGQTIYELKQGQVAGHWQVVDRLGFLEQLRAPEPSFFQDR
jgi:steroid delta-isomerase-like uncharacterized protein